MSNPAPLTLPTPEELTAAFGGEWKPDPWGRSMVAAFGPFELHLRLGHDEATFAFFVAKSRALDFGFHAYGRDWHALATKVLRSFHEGVAHLPKVDP